MVLIYIALFTTFVIGLLSFSIPNLLLWLYVKNLRGSNPHKRVAVLQSLRVRAPGTKKLVGFFHPYWYVPVTIIVLYPEKPLILNSSLCIV